MAIVSMMRLEAVAPRSQVRRLTRSLVRLSCVELSRPETDAEGFVPSVPDTEALREKRAMVDAAADELSRRYPVKKSALAAKKELSEAELLDADYTQVYAAAERIGGILAELRTLDAEDVAAREAREALEPWRPAALPLSYGGTAHMTAGRITFPADVSPAEAGEALENDGIAAAVSEVSEGRELRCAWLFAYRGDEERAWSVLKGFGALRAPSLPYDGTPEEALAAIGAAEKARALRRQALTEELASLASFREGLERASDALSMEQTRAELSGQLLESKRCAVLEGWIPKEKQAEVERVLRDAGCAYEISEPGPEDEPPVAFKSNKFVQQFNFITEMYGMPAYNSLIDPNPVMAPFFLLFFGMMMGDFGYGLLVTAACAIVIKKLHPKGFFGSLMQVMLWSGMSMMLWGVLFGAYFGDVIAQVSENFFGKRVAIPAVLMDPMTQPLNVLILSFALGLVHIVTGMGVSAWRQIRRGKWFDAVCDVGFWYCIFAGLVAAILGAGWGLYLALGGVAGILIFGGRHSPTVIGKITGGLPKLYDVTSYLSDILSYSRLLALGLATSIVASVFNILGTLGSGVLGVILFLIVFPVGHAFNLVINILGAFVHSLRLQYIEFFGKFYEGGGRPFAPAVYRTKNYQIKE